MYDLWGSSRSWYIDMRRMFPVVPHYLLLCSRTRGVRNSTLPVFMALLGKFRPAEKPSGYG